MTIKARYTTFAAYAAWADARLYGACAALPPEALERDFGAFFGSILRTLNHVLVADRIWLRRLTGGGETYDRLDVVPWPRFADLRTARTAETARLAAFVESLDDAALEAPVRYANMAGVPREQPLSTALDHLSNHQTHHRGQVHALISIAGGEPPPLDLIYFHAEAGVTRVLA